MSVHSNTVPMVNLSSARCYAGGKLHEIAVAMMVKTVFSLYAFRSCGSNCSVILLFVVLFVFAA